MLYYNSQYNFCFFTETGILLYNAKTGATYKIGGKDAKILTNILTGSKKEIKKDLLPDNLLNLFLDKGFLVQSNRNELLEIREKYWKARGETPMVLTITTTMNCNLGCYYCYEERSQKKLQFNDIATLVDNLTKSYREKPFLSLHVDWYGGEPLLNQAFLENASYAIQEFCNNNEVNYHASVVSNGTEWPEDVQSFITNHKIRQVQISFDGLQKNHDKSRHYRKGFNPDGKSSFQVAYNLVDKLLDCVQVDIRFNIDWNTKNDIFPFLDQIIEQGWFQKKHKAVFQPAKLSAYTEKSSFMRKKQLTNEEFDAIRLKIRKRLTNIGDMEESEMPENYPFPRNHVCAALASKSMVVGADQLIYRCGLQVGETHRAVGAITDPEKEFKDTNWWNSFDPTRQPSCSKCSFLPICFGGCPKKHLEGDQEALDEMGDYWRTNLAVKVAAYVNEKLVDTNPLPETDQFRELYQEKRPVEATETTATTPKWQRVNL